MKQTYALLGVFRYEFWMQIRRPTLWLAFLVLAAMFGIGSDLIGFLLNSHHDTCPVASATPLQGVESMLLLISIAILVLYVLWGLLKWQQARQ